MQRKALGGAVTPGDYSADEFEEDDDEKAGAVAAVNPADTLNNKFHVSLGGEESGVGTSHPNLNLRPTGGESDDPLEGTSKFGGAPADQANDSFDNAFDKGDEGVPAREVDIDDDAGEDFMVPAKPRRPQWG